MLYGFLLLVCIVGAGGCQNEPSATSSTLTNQHALREVHHESVSPIVTSSEDDLSWLVGRWRCYARQYLRDVGPLGAGAEDTLEYFNVYFPYANDNITVKLTDDPRDRPIAAEFLVRSMDVSALSKDQDEMRFHDRLVPMTPKGLVSVSKDIIGISYPMGYTFHYRRERRANNTLWLILESGVMHLELCKMTPQTGPIKDSWAIAPIKDYSHEHTAELQQKYSDLKKLTSQP